MDLRSPSLRSQTEFKGARQTLVGGILAALVVIGVFLPYQYFNGNLKDVREEVKKEEAEKQRLEGVRKKIQRYQNQQRKPEAGASRSSIGSAESNRTGTSS